MIIICYTIHYFPPAVYLMRRHGQLPELIDLQNYDAFGLKSEGLMVDPLVRLFTTFSFRLESVQNLKVKCCKRRGETKKPSDLSTCSYKI